MEPKPKPARPLIDGRYLLHLAIAACIGALAMLMTLTMLNRTRPAPIVLVPPEPTATPGPTGTPSPLQVYVNGEVVAPGVYLLERADRVGDAIDAAGGFGRGAFEEAVNLAEPLYDGMQVYVPPRPQPGETPPSIGMESGSEPGGHVPAGQVNINTADAELLQSLPGVGPSTAEAIVRYREENGPFTQIEGLMNVKGIGQGKFNQVADLITVD